MIPMPSSIPPLSEEELDEEFERAVWDWENDYLADGYDVGFLDDPWGDRERAE
jgi:hypothetical protein